MKPIDKAYQLGAAQAFEDFMKKAEGLGDPMFWQGGQEAMAPEGAPPQGSTAEDAALALPPGIFQGLQMKVNPDGQRSTTVKVTPDALQAPDALAGIFQAEPEAKVEMALPQAGGGEGKGGGPADMGVPEGAPVDGAGAMPIPGVPPKVAEYHKFATTKTRIERESNPEVNEEYPWNKKTKAERDADKLLRMKMR